MNGANLNEKRDGHTPKSTINLLELDKIPPVGRYEERKNDSEYELSTLSPSSFD
jgi:hypothetical protein